MTTEVEAEERTVEEEEAAQVEAAREDAPAPLEELAAEPEATPLPVALAVDDLARVIESLLFVSPGPLRLESLQEATGAGIEPLREALALLSARHQPGQSGLALAEVGGAYQLRTAPAHAEQVRRLLRVRPQKLTRAALETLALVAYRQPVTRPEIEDVRGVDSGAVLKALLERRLVKILGKREEIGRPLIYGTTKEFLEFFSLEGLQGLPSLREFQELSEEHRSIVEKETGEAPVVTDLTELSRSTLADKLAETAEEGEQALDFLEAAMAEAEARSRHVDEQLVEKAEAPVATAAESSPGVAG